MVTKKLDLIVEGLKKRLEVSGTESMDEFRFDYFGIDLSLLYQGYDGLLTLSVLTRNYGWRRVFDLYMDRCSVDDFVNIIGCVALAVYTGARFELN